MADASALLLAAVVDGDAEEVRRLLEGDDAADPNATNRYGNSALTLAASNGHAACLIHLLKAGANPDAVDGRRVPALSSASMAGNVACVQILLDASANASQASPRGRTALHHACRNTSSLPCVEVLLSSPSVEVDSVDYEGFTALHVACKNGHVDAAAQLLHAGANMAAEDKQKRTPLFVASAMDREDCVAFLIDVLESEDEMQHSDHRGDTPFIHQIY